MIINSDRKIQMISDSQASESATFTLFGINPEKGRWIFGARTGDEHMSGQHTLVELFWTATAKPLVYRCNRQLIAIYLVSSVFRPFDAFSGGPLDQCGPLQIKRVRDEKKFRRVNV